MILRSEVVRARMGRFVVKGGLIPLIVEPLIAIEVLAVLMISVTFDAREDPICGCVPPVVANSETLRQRESFATTAK